MKTILGILGFVLSIVLAFIVGASYAGPSVKIGEGFWYDITEAWYEYASKH